VSVSVVLRAFALIAENVDYCRVMGKSSKRKRNKGKPEAAPVLAAAAVHGAHRWSGLAVIGLALAVRLVGLAEIAPSPLMACPAPDSEYYIRIGAELREAGLWSGGDFLINPLYTILVGWLQWMVGLSGIRLLQIALGVLTAWMIYRIGARVFGERAGLFAGFAYALYPMAALFTLTLVPATFAMSGCAGAVLLALRTGPGGRAAPALAVGLLLGLTTLTRPNLLLWAGAFVIWYWLVAPRAARWKPVLLLVLGVALPLTVNAARNYSVSGEPILIASNGGINFYFGNYPGCTAAFSTPHGFPDTPLEQLAAARQRAEAETGREMGPSEVSSYWFNRGLENLAAHPAQSIRLWAGKTALMFNARELPINEGLVEFGHFSRLFAIPFPWLGLVIPLSLTGLFFAIPGRVGRPGLWLLLLVLAAHFAGLVPFFVSSRHRLPQLVALLPFAGMAVFELHRRWKEKETRRLMQGLVVLAVAAIVCWVPLTPDVDHHAYNRLGCIFLEVEEYTRAEEMLRRAMTMDPGFADAHFNLGVTMTRLSRADEAMAAYQRVLALEPDHRETLLNISSHLYRSGRLQEAEGRYLELLRLHPDFATAHYNLALIRARTGRQLEALAGFTDVIRLDPGHAMAHLQSGLILKNDTARSELAATHFRTYLRLEPQGRHAAMARTELAKLTAAAGP